MYSLKEDKRSYRLRGSSGGQSVSVAMENDCPVDQDSKKHLMPDACEDDQDGRKLRIWQQSPAMIGIMCLSIIILSRLQELHPLLSKMKLGMFSLALSMGLVFVSKPANHVPWMKIPQFKMVLFLLLWMPLSSYLGHWPSFSFTIYMNYLRTFLFYYLLVKSVYSMSDLRKLMLVIVCSIVIFDLSLIASGAGGRARVGATLDANDAALLIGMMSPFAYSFFRRGKGWVKYVALGALVLGIGAVFATQSRGGLITLGVSLSYSFLADKGSFFKKVLFIVVTLALLVALMPSHMQERFSRLGDAEQDYNMSDKHGRMMIWGRALSIIKANPVFGVGMGCFTFVDSEVNNQSKGLVAHNFMLQVSSELGLPGGICLVGMLVLSWFQIRKIRRDGNLKIPPETMSLLSALQISIVAFLLGAQFLSLAYSSFVLFLVGCSTIVWKCYLQGHFDSLECSFGKPIKR